MLSKILGWIYIIGSPLFFISFIVLTLVPLLSGGRVESLSQPIIGILALFLAVYAFMLGSGIKSRKVWSWYAGMITLSLVSLSSLVTLVLQHNISMILTIFLNLLGIYALMHDKNDFFSKVTQPQTITTPPVNNSINTPQPLTPVTPTQN